MHATQFVIMAVVSACLAMFGSYLMPAVLAFGKLAHQWTERLAPASARQQDREHHPARVS
jgi:hypothetical protein